MCLGTFNWQAPETIIGGKTTFSADIWSMGVFLLEIITGELQKRGFYSEPRYVCPKAQWLDDDHADSASVRPRQPLL